MKKLFWLNLFAVPLVFSLASMPARAAEEAVKNASDELGLDDTTITKDSDEEFVAKLNAMLTRTDKSLKILREQIIRNQSAPFLADLYLQLGDLLSQKSTVLYYLQMQRDNKTDTKTMATQKFSPVVIAQQEAITVYQDLLKEFPKFDKRDKVLYRLATSLKSIDENAAFVVNAEKLIKEYPNTKEAVQARLLLGQNFYDMMSYTEALQHLNVVKDSPYPYERNAARYRIGLIRLNTEKHKEALAEFESVALDDELKEDLNPNQVSLATKSAKTNLKREALIDSVRAYTEVFKTNAEPVAYYSKIAPSESLFQETLEKLAFRYIFLRNYSFAIKLLRTLSERTADPQKVMNIYQEVLAMIPLNDRIDLPVPEMEFVLDRYNDWSSHYEQSPDLAKKTFTFFETQIRELGTRAHDIAKKEPDPKKKEHLYERARQLYHLYLGFFDKGPRAVKIAINLGDVYYNQRNFFQSGSYYLRTFTGEFGPATGKVELIQNAILALQKPAEYQFYEQVRAKGLLVKSINSYMAIDPKKKNDAALSFALAKAYYDQGYYKTAFTNLYAFIKKFPNAREAEGAADLVLHYYNTRSDFKGLATATDKMLKLGVKNATLVAHLKEVNSKAQLKRLDEQVKTRKGYDVLSQSRSYLQTAMELKDSGLRSAALEQALARSKSEKDVETFLATAGTMAKVEKDPKKKSDILNSMADETLGITRFYQSLNILGTITNDASIPPNVRTAALEKSLKIAAMVRDPEKIANLLRNPLIKSVSAETKSSVTQQLMTMLESPVSLPVVIQDYLAKSATTDENLLVLFKAQTRLSAAVQKPLQDKIRSFCAGPSARSATTCKWAFWSGQRAKIAAFTEIAGKAPLQLQAIEGVAGKMTETLDGMRVFEGSGDPQLDMLAATGNAQIFNSFASYLERCASANKEVAPVLKQKANESLIAAKKSLGQCQTISQSAAMISPANNLCQQRGIASVEQVLTWKQRSALASLSRDPGDQGIIDQQKAIFVARDNWKAYFSLGEAYLEKKNWQHAIATAALGRSTFPQSEEEFNAIMGCGLVNAGLLNEGQFYLAKSSDMNGHSAECKAQLKKIGGQ